jgi:hypothetical protein
MSKLETLKQKATQAEQKFDAAIDAGKDRATIIRLGKVMDKWQNAYHAELRANGIAPHKVGN